MKTRTKPAVAADYMQTDVIAIAPNDTLRDALALMTQNHVTGLPVMDSNCRCIGLITASDILNYEQESVNDETDGATTKVFDVETQQWESMAVSAFGLERFGDVSVNDVMTRDLVSVRRSTPLKEVAKRMLDDQVHRVVVTDDKQRIFGILSAFDMVRVVADGSA